MAKYISKRILQMIPMLIILSIVVFLMVRLIPGDPVTMMLGQGAGKAAIEAEKVRLGLDKPMLIQYLIWMKNIFSGDLGMSISTHKPVVLELIRRYPTTIKLAVGATVVSTVFGVLFGMISSVWRGKFPDNALRVVSLIAVSTPSYFLAMLLMLLFCLKLGWLPVTGFDTV
ncbi:MAG: ABC transporter permease, partial [Oscillospiraceae bacterium]